MATVEHFPTLETRRLILRELTQDEAESVYHYLSDPEVIRYLEGSVDSLAEAAGYVKWCRDTFHHGMTDVRWGIELKSSGTLIGDCGYGHIDEPRRPTELGYMLAKEHWGNGFMAEVLNTILPFGFDQLHLHRIQAWTHPDNAVSAHLLEKFGFRKEGTLREHIYIWHQGAYIDTDMYALLDKDFTR